MKKVMISILCAMAMVMSTLGFQPVFAKKAAAPKISAQAKAEKSKKAKKVKKAKKKNKTITLYADSVTQKTKKLKVKNVKTWTTSNRKVVTVKNGKLKALKKGKATISAKTSKKTLKWQVIVKKVKLNKNAVSLKKGGKFTLKLIGEKIKSIKSSQKKIATVSQKGVVSAKKKGTSKITVTGRNKKKYTARITVISNNENRKKSLAEEAAEYDYKIEPVLAPFCSYYFVTTTYPHPENIRFAGVNVNNKETAITMDQHTFADISYYDEARKQVKKDTYLFKLGASDSVESTPMTGDLSLEVTSEAYEAPNKQYSGGFVISTYHERKFTDCNKKIALPAGLESKIDYLIHTYADPVSGSLFDKLNAVSKGLGSLDVYPKGLVDRTESTGLYQALAVSPYEELSLNTHTNIYKRASKSLFTAFLYPYVLDSLGTPGTMSKVAKVLDPNCSVVRGNNHWEIKVTANGETHTYGGAGTGSTNNIYLDLTGKDYTFNGDDLLAGGLSAMREKYLEYGKASDEAARELYKPLESSEIAKVIAQSGNHAWVSVAIEGSSSKAIAYYYLNPLKDYAYCLSDCWVDGHYVGKHEAAEKDATFEKHPTANILLQDQTFKDYHGKEVTADRLYRYNEKLKLWIAADSTYSYQSNVTKETLDQAKVSYLTPEDVAKLNVDGNTNQWPAAQYIYDGTAAPGTKC